MAISKVEVRPDGTVIVEYDAPGRLRSQAKTVRDMRQFRINFSTGTVIAFVIGLLVAGGTTGDLAMTARIICFSAAFLLGIPLVAWWQIPKLHPSPFVRVVCGCLWALFMGTLASSVIRHTEPETDSIFLRAEIVDSAFSPKQYAESIPTFTFGDMLDTPKRLQAAFGGDKRFPVHPQKQYLRKRILKTVLLR
jgi:hypothetical protein